MKAYVLLAPFVLSVLFLTGCASLPPAPRTQTASAGPETYNVRYRNAKASARMLEPGLAQDYVRGLLGQPDKTSAGTCGQGIGQPWECLTWTYTYLGHLNQQQLVLIFRRDPATNAWLLNGWDWF